MRVVETDNFGRDYPNERFRTESLSLEDAKKFADDLNEKGGEYASGYFKVVDDNYTLQPGFEP